MPRIEFEQLPADARVWVFGADRELNPVAVSRLTAEVDLFLDGWAAHGAPLTCSQTLRDRRFLAIGVDQRSAGASGCSIDGLFRTLQSLERAIGASFVGGGLVHYREASGEIRTLSRDEFAKCAARGEIDPRTPVFDTTVDRRDAWESKFERPAGESWHATLLQG